MSLQGREVQLIHDVSGMGTDAIPRGLSGRCEWDEGGVDVIVEFERDVPNGGLLINKKQAWIPRQYLKITQ